MKVILNNSNPYRTTVIVQHDNGTEESTTPFEFLEGDMVTLTIKLPKENTREKRSKKHSNIPIPHNSGDHHR